LKQQVDKKDKLINNQSRQLESFQIMIQSKEDKIYKLEGEVEEKNKSVIDKMKGFFI